MWPLVAEHNTPGHRAAEGCVPATVSVEEAAREWNVGGCLQEAACERQDGATLLASFHKVLVKAGFATEPDGLGDPTAHVRAMWEKVHASEEVPNQFHG